MISRHGGESECEREAAGRGHDAHTASWWTTNDARSSVGAMLRQRCGGELSEGNVNAVCNLICVAL